MSTQFYERTALSRNKASLLKKGAVREPDDAVTAEEELKDPFVLEFLGLKDEYSETELEEALHRRGGLPARPHRAPGESTNQEGGGADQGYGQGSGRLA